MLILLLLLLLLAEPASDLPRQACQPVWSLRPAESEQRPTPAVVPALQFLMRNVLSVCWVAGVQANGGPGCQPTRRFADIPDAAMVIVLVSTADIAAICSWLLLSLLLLLLWHRTWCSRRPNSRRAATLLQVAACLQVPELVMLPLSAQP
jgi:hypothetical protein